MSEPPRLDLTEKRQHVLHFEGVVPALTNRTFVSSVIPFRFKIRRVEIASFYDPFPLVQAWVLTSGNTSASTTGPPPDNNIARYSSPNAYFGANNMIRRIDLNYSPPDEDRVVKVHFYNGLAGDYNADATIIIEEE